MFYVLRVFQSIFVIGACDACFSQHFLPEPVMYVSINLCYRSLWCMFQSIFFTGACGECFSQHLLPEPVVYVSEKVLLGRAVCSIEQDASHVLVTDIHGNTYRVGLPSL